ncbi:hypothetical protein DCCM_3828 [Desulfocucumis palustris]|uniref:Uncharacterized protein n=1 Tax=Desulfocucumis palustris TaxID=1898651 RepID=A0A2L2XEP4_9FIRM|nr:hypothetical protein DCCM_3828 [Desulfocucumis palustris]
MFSIYYRIYLMRHGILNISGYTNLTALFTWKPGHQKAKF